MEGNPHPGQARAKWGVKEGEGDPGLWDSTLKGPQFTPPTHTDQQHECSELHCQPSSEPDVCLHPGRRSPERVIPSTGNECLANGGLEH